MPSIWRTLIFKVPTPQLLERLVTELDELYTQIDKMPDKQDARGDLYEYMLSKLAQAGTNGQFRTPRHIIRMMVEFNGIYSQATLFATLPVVQVAFLVAAGQYLKER